MSMSLSCENIANKQPIRRLEIPINKFNDVAIPHHLDLLNRHKCNIKKYRQAQEWDRVYKEQVNTSRLVLQLKQLLYEIDMLRSQVLDSDIDKFDKLTATSRQSVITAIEECLELEFDLPLRRQLSTEDEDQSTEDPLDNRSIQLEAEKEKLEREEACLHTWNSLQHDMQELHELYIEFNKVVMDQKKQVDDIEDNVEVAAENVTEGEKILKKASKYKMTVYPVTGALIATCIGGPIGLIAGLKIGSLAAVGLGILGFTGGTLIKKKLDPSITEEKNTDTSHIQGQSLKKESPARGLKESKKYS
ncbi:syntaxin-17 [Orussus abietinus]|uniref:syntaxin-17 n=1 Tax=Orussus abietinus TaxID=222816 RepID=UPI000C715E11|nr:syntaxin-17 [Orussus abietinus]